VRVVRLPAAEPLRAHLVRWLAAAAAGVIVVAAGHATLMAVTGYVPLGAGIDTRVNVIAGVGYVILTVAVAMLLVGLVAGSRLDARVAAVGAAVISLALGGLYLQRLREHKVQYVSAHRQQEEVLEVFRNQIARPPAGTRVFTFGTPDQAAPGVPVFQATWSLSGALRVMWGDEEVRAAPQGTMTELRCLDDAVLPVGTLYDDSWRTAYGRALFVDTRTGESTFPADRAECQRWVDRRFGLPA